MRLFLTTAAALILAAGTIASAETDNPQVSVQNVESRNSVNGCGQFRFDADLVTTNWPPGIPHNVSYRWERTNGHHWAMRHITIGPSGKKHLRAELKPTSARTGFAWVHVYAPKIVISPKVGFSNPNC
jgi:hypothetical protein